ncbi:DUF2849 domain-containing protein [Sphingosinicella terrae]|jgi:hypothetical protein|uniref:DUF2849 domain-containing protein n=1 Tax=Sphingosinicella terrae TaxID=2172047 RepID=UPI000E0D5632|nr:DUF2849 domain-containing protein [Sphingosinicella terrae]
MAGKRPALPLVLSASDLLDGDVVFHTGAGWDRSLSAALVATDEAGAQRLEAALAEVESGGPVAEPFLFTVTLDPSGAAVPNHYRERIRVCGPTVRHDFGPQAREELSHVSL